MVAGGSIVAMDEPLSNGLIAEIHRQHEEIEKLRAENARLLALNKELLFEIDALNRMNGRE